MNSWMQRGRQGVESRTSLTICLVLNSTILGTVEQVATHDADGGTAFSEGRHVVFQSATCGA